MSKLKYKQRERMNTKDWMTPVLTLGGKSVLFSLQIQMLISIRSILTDIPRIMFNQYLDTAVDWSYLHIKLTITMCLLYYQNCRT